MAACHNFSWTQQRSNCSASYLKALHKHAVKALTANSSSSRASVLRWESQQSLTASPPFKLATSLLYWAATAFRLCFQRPGSPKQHASKALRCPPKQLQQLRHTLLCYGQLKRCQRVRPATVVATAAGRKKTACALAMGGLAFPLESALQSAPAAMHSAQQSSFMA